MPRHTVQLEENEDEICLVFYVDGYVTYKHPFKNKEDAQSRIKQLVEHYGYWEVEVA